MQIVVRPAADVPLRDNPADGPSALIVGIDAIEAHLDEAADSGQGGVTFLGGSPYWRDAQARQDPRFDELLRRIGYPMETVVVA